MSHKLTLIQSESSIWDDSDCTVDDETSPSNNVRCPKATLEFRNTLITNKGDIHKAKEYSSCSTTEEEDNVDLFSLSQSVDSFSWDSQDSLEF